MNVLQRLWNSFGLSDRFDEVEYDYEYEEDVLPESQSPGEYDPTETRSTPANNVIGLPNRAMGQTEMCLIEPRSFEEMPQAVMALRERKSVILNLGLMDADLAQRCVDFVAGGAFAIDGHQERLGEHIFLFTPSFVQISNYAATGQPSVVRSPAPMPPTQMPLTPLTPPPAAWAEKTRLMQ